MSEASLVDSDPLWYKDAIIYQLHVKSFFDAKGEGIGNFVGLTGKLDYLESLGVTALWLLPFYPSPLRDDGYDIADYMGIHPSYGTMAEFKDFLDEAHKRGIRVITELVLNHTSDQHEWFKKSRTAKPGTYWRDFYVWNNDDRKYRDARIIFKDFENSNWTWDSQAQAYFWHRFYSHQPDLNFENPNVHKALLKVIDFWLDLGVDGMRLDAVPYLYEQEGTNCENLPQTFAFLKKLRAHVEAKYPGRMLLAEANQWPEDAVAYFGAGDSCHMAFHFPLMPRLFMALQREDRFPIIDILEQTPSIPDSAQWAIFLRNHDELTLEMVSEEERDFMYRSYAHETSARINLGIRRRLAPLLKNSRRRIELLNFLLFSLPGTPVVYYGDEIGMGDNHYLGDRNGVRTPMQWSSDGNAGFSQANPQKLFLPVIIDPEYHYQSVNVLNEDRNLSSLLWWMRRTIAMRRAHQAFSRGTIEFIHSDNPCILAFVRKLGDQVVLVAANLSRFAQAATLDLSAYAGSTPVDMFSNNRFPRITSAPYQFTFGFHDYFWLKLRPERSADLRNEAYALPDFKVTRRWTDILVGASARALETDVLPEYLQQRTTVGCKSLRIQQVSIEDRITVSSGAFTAVLCFVRVRYQSGEKDLILLPLTVEPESRVASVIGEDKGLVLGLINGGKDGLLYDCTYHPSVQSALLQTIFYRKVLKGERGQITGEAHGKRMSTIRLPSSFVKPVFSGQRNSCISIENAFFVKIFRRLEHGPNPDVEIRKVFSEGLAGIAPRPIGNCVYTTRDKEQYDLGLVTEYFPHSRTLWNSALDAVSIHLEESLAQGAPPSPRRLPPSLSLVSSSHSQTHDLFENRAVLVGQLAGRMHRTLASGSFPESVRVEPFSMLYQRSLYQSFRGLVKRVFSRITANREHFPEGTQELFRQIVASDKELIAFCSTLLKRKIPSVRMRIHGDFHLGHIMVMDERHLVCDFEGTPNLPLGERRLKRSPLRDVASMVHSFHWAAFSAYLNLLKVQERDRIALHPCASQWAADMSAHFFSSYRRTVHDMGIIPSDDSEIQGLIHLYLIERVLVDIDGAMTDDPSRLPIAAHCLRRYIQPLPSLS